MNRHQGNGRRLDRLPRLRLLIAILLLAGLLSTLVEGFFRNIIVVPILETLNAMHRLYAAPPQVLIWWGMLAIGSALSLRALWLWPPKRRGDEDAPIIEGRVARLAGMLPRAERSDYFRWQLAQELEMLAVATLQQAHGAQADAIRQGVLAGTLAVGPGLKALFRACAAIPGYRQFVTRRADAGRKPMGDLAGLDLALAVAELEAWFNLVGAPP